MPAITTVCMTACGPSDTAFSKGIDRAVHFVDPEGVLPPLQPPPPMTTWLMFVPVAHCTMNPPWEAPPLVTYHIPLDKARSIPKDTEEYFIPPGSLADPSILIRPASQTTPFEFPFNAAEETYCDFNVCNSRPQPCLMDSVTPVVGLPQVCGLSLVDDVVVWALHSTTALGTWDNPSLVNGGGNICLTGVLDFLVEVVLIAPLPISVATKNGDISLNDCCTKCGLLLLTLVDGMVYY